MYHSKKLTIALLFSCFSFQAQAIERGFICDDLCCLDDRYQIYLGADLLYWTGCQQGLDFFVKETIKEDASILFTKHSATFDWDVGFRLLAGFEMQPEAMGANLCYTYWDNDEINGHFVDETLSQEKQKEAVHAHHHINYQVVDALLSRSLPLTETGTLVPFFGFRALFLDQKNKIETLLKEDKIVITDTHSKFHSTLFGVGIHGGLAFRWTLFDDFGFYSLISASLLEGRQHSNHKTFSDPALLLKESQSMPVPGLHLSVGGNWESCFSSCGEESWVTLELGYEFNQWFNTAQSVRKTHESSLLDNSARSDLLLQGLSVRLCYEF